MLGDFLPNNTNPNGAGAAVKSRPQNRPTSGGYGSSNFGDTDKPALPHPTVSQHPRPVQSRAVTQSKPQVNQAQPVARTASIAEASAPAAVVLPISKTRRGIDPLLLTIGIVVIFIAGVVALFVYALSGQ